MRKWFDFYQPGWFIIETLLTYGSERILYEYTESGKQVIEKLPEAHTRQG